MKYAVLGAWMLMAAAAHAAPPICDTLKPLVNDPEHGFVALRAEPEEQPKYWQAKPFLDHAKCDVWTSEKAIAHNLRCVANDRFDASAVTAFYQAAVKDIDACLVDVKGGSKFKKAIEPVSMPLLKGQMTDWVLDTDTARIKIEVTDYLRTKTNSSYNSLSVEFLKY
jgi:hypothetical protein